MKKVHFAVVGLGAIAKTHIIALKALPVIKTPPVLPVLDTIVTRSPEERAPQAEAMGFAHVSASLEEAIAARSIDAVDICTPNALHLEPVRHASKAGISVYCEKPLTETYDRSVELVAAAKGTPISQTALTFRYHPAVMRIRESLRQRLIGDVLQCRISYRRSGYLDASRPLTWRMRDDLSGGGAISDLGVHVLDLFRHFFGELKSVTGRTNTYVKRRPETAGGEPVADVRVDDWADMTVETAGGVLGTAEVSRIAWGAEAFEINITGTRGGISVDLEKEYVPRIKLLDGTTPKLPVPASLELIPDEKSTMGMSVDCHFGGLNHFLHRLAGEDRWEGLAPSLDDCLRVEGFIDRVLQENRR